MSHVDNLNNGSEDPFNGRADDETEQSAIINKKKKTNDIHIRVQQRNGRKCITTLQGLRQDLDFERMAKEFRRRWGCNGIVVDDKEAGKVIQLQGDQREHLTDFLITEKLAHSDNIKIFGGS